MDKKIKILIVRFSSIGDIVLTTPVVRCLKKQLPNVEVHFCTKHIHRSLVEKNTYIDKHYTLNSGFRELISQLKLEEYDYIIDLHNSLRSNLLKLSLGVQSFTLHKLNILKWLYVVFKIDLMPQRHLVDRYLATVAPLGVIDDGLGLDFFIAPADQVTVTELPTTHQSSYVAYAIGGQYATKRLPVPRMIELCRKIDGPIVLLGDENDRRSGDEVVNVLGKALIYNACGKYSLCQSASLLQQAKVVFSHDTSLMHIAAALKKKVFSIWGNTTPQLGMYPYKTSFVVLQKKDLACRPCSKIGFNRCPAGHFRCMNELPFTFEVSDLNQETDLKSMQTIP